MFIEGIGRGAEGEIKVGTAGKVGVKATETEGGREKEDGHGPVNRGALLALLATDHSYDPSLNIIYVIGRVHGTVEIVEGINLAGLNFFLKFKFFLFYFFLYFIYIFF